MSSLSEITISVLESVPPTSATTKVIIGVLILTMATFGTHYASPMHLLVAAISNVEKTYFEAIEAGVLTKSNVHTTETLSSVQIKVSSIREASLRNYLSTRQEFREFFKGRSFTILKCIREVRKLEADIEILKEHLRAPDLEVRVGTISLRQRYTHASSSKFYKCQH